MKKVAGALAFALALAAGHAHAETPNEQAAPTPPATTAAPAGSDKASCESETHLRYDYAFGTRAADQAVSSDHRLVGLHHCLGLLYEHVALYEGAAPGGTLWIDRGAFVVGGGDSRTEGYLYLAHTTVYGLQSTRTGTLGALVTDRTYAPWGADFAFNLPLAKLFPGSSILTDPAELDAELAARLETRHAAVRVGYRVVKVHNIRRGTSFLGYSLLF